jgi:hypothetical protein
MFAKSVIVSKCRAVAGCSNVVAIVKVNFNNILPGTLNQGLKTACILVKNEFLDCAPAVVVEPPGIDPLVGAQMTDLLM